MGLSGKLTGRLRRAWLDRLPLDAVKSRLARRRGVLTLCYHSLAPDLEDYPYRTDAAAFDAHVALLKQVSEILPAGEAVRALRERSARSRDRLVSVICFDDGYRDNWTEATPILEKHDVPATLFAARDLIRRGGDTHMDEAELAALARHPLWRVGAHAVTHNVLTGYRRRERIDEMQGCKDWLSDLLGRAPEGFAYPQGQISADIVELARARFDHAFATDRRVSRGFDAAQIRRFCPTRREDRLEAFARALLLAPVEDGTA